MAGNEPERVQLELLEAEMERKAEELRVFSEMRMESGFTPRASLQRTPPQGFSTPLGEPVLASPGGDEDGDLPLAGEKRLLSSPEEVQEAVRRRVGRRTARGEVPPLGGLLSRPVIVPPSPSPPPAPPATGQQVSDELVSAPVATLAGLATASTRGIMEAVKAKGSKLNKEEMAAIGVHTERLAAVVLHLTLRVSAAENRAALAEMKVGTSGVARPVAADAPVLRSFANALRLGKGQEPVPIARPPGPSVVIYPSEDQKQNMKTAEDTRKALLGAVKPGQLGLQIAGVRKVGNAGVVVQTTSAASADALKKAVPATFRTTEPTERQPVIALTGIDREATLEAVLEDIKVQNLQEDDAWTTERLSKELRVLYRKNRHANRTRWVSKAPEISKNMACTYLFEPSLTVRMISFSAVTVDFPGENPCWEVKIWLPIVGAHFKITRSKILVRRLMMDGIVRESTGPVYYPYLVSSPANFERLREFAYRWHSARSALERQDRSYREDATT